MVTAGAGEVVGAAAAAAEGVAGVPVEERDPGDVGSESEPAGLSGMVAAEVVAVTGAVVMPVILLPRARKASEGEEEEVRRPLGRVVMECLGVGVGVAAVIAGIQEERQQLANGSMTRA